MSKKRDSADASDTLLATPPNVTDTVAAPKKLRKPRAKRPYRLEEFGRKGVIEEEFYQPVKDAPDFDDTATAHKWAEINSLPKADYRVVRVMSEIGRAHV